MSDEMHDETRWLVRQSGDRIPVRPAPVDDLLAGGHRARRRRSALAAGAVVVAVGLVSGGAVAVGAHLTSGASERPTATAPPDVSSLTPPPGMRYVGRNSIAVAIPTSWRIAASRVRSAEDVIRWQGPAGQPRPGAFQPALRPSVSLEPYRYAHFYAPHARPIAAIGSAALNQYGPYPGCAFSDCVLLWPYFEGAVLSRQADVFIWVTAHTRAEVATILHSVTAIPSGSVIIPDRASPLRLSRLGFQVERAFPYVITAGPRFLGTRPAAGSVVSRGSRVTIFLRE